jgi:hypothetical protein
MILETDNKNLKSLQNQPIINPVNAIKTELEFFIRVLPKIYL